MGEMKHTPGPWIVGKGGPNGCPVVGTNKGLLVCMVSHSVNLPSQTEKARADAALIAAAPDLCAVAEAVVAADQSDLGVIDLLLELKRIARSARAALSKAEGRSLSSASGQEGEGR